MPLALQGGQAPSGFMQVAAQSHTLRLCGMAPQKLLPAQGQCSTASNSQTLTLTACPIATNLVIYMPHPGSCGSHNVTLHQSERQRQFRNEQIMAGWQQGAPKRSRHSHGGTAHHS